MIEVKQGPYVAEGDKTRFPGIKAEHVAPFPIKNETCAC